MDAPSISTQPIGLQSSLKTHVSPSILHTPGATYTAFTATAQASHTTHTVTRLFLRGFTTKTVHDGILHRPLVACMYIIASFITLLALSACHL
jgi:hypothetical protein